MGINPLATEPFSIRLHHKLLLICLLGILSYRVIAQVPPVHKVEKGETLYGIARKYHLSTDQITLWNPTIKDGLKAGMELSLTPPPPAVYSVVVGDTWYGIGRKLGRPAEELKALNPGVSELKPGQTLRLNGTAFSSDKMYEAASTTAASTPVVRQPKPEGNCDLAVVLPFYLDKNNFALPEITEESTEETQPKPPAVASKSEPALEFMEGLQLALDSLGRTGWKGTVRVLDAPTDSSDFAAWISEGYTDGARVVVGPFHAQHQALLADRCRSKGQAYVAPFAQQGKLLLNNSGAGKVQASATTQMESLAASLGSAPANRQVMMVHNNLKKEKSLAEAFRAAFKSMGSKDSLREWIYKTGGWSALKNKLSSTKNNILVVTSNDQAFVSDLLAKLSSMDPMPNIQVLGTEAWLSYDNLEIKMLCQLKVRLPSNMFVPFARAETVHMLRAFREAYHTDPSRVGFVAYDLGLYVLPSLLESGPDGWKKLDGKMGMGIQSRWRFMQSSPESGYENHGTWVLEYRNEDLIPLDPQP
jgi:LysM repeat protein